MTISTIVNYCEMFKNETGKEYETPNDFGSTQPTWDFTHWLIEKLEDATKHDVWENAPNWANNAQIHWFTRRGQKDFSAVYTRTLPKSRIDEIAEEVANTEFNRDVTNRPAFPKRDVVDIIKSAIMKYRETRSKG